MSTWNLMLSDQGKYLFQHRTLVIHNFITPWFKGCKKMALESYFQRWLFFFFWEIFSQKLFVEDNLGSDSSYFLSKEKDSQNKSKDALLDRNECAHLFCYSNLVSDSFFFNLQPSKVSHMIQKILCSLSTQANGPFCDMVKVRVINM